MPICFKVLEAPDLASGLTELQYAEFISAANFHALCHPNSTIEFQLAIGNPTQLPVLTDERTLTGKNIEGTFCVTVRVQSLALGTSEPEADEMLVRYLRLAHAEATPASVTPLPESLPRRLYRAIEHRSPGALDIAREIVIDRRERTITRPLRRTTMPSTSGTDKLPILHIEYTARLTPQPAVLFGLHWLQTGGAERWAVDSIGLAKKKGFLPIVVTDQNSIHPWLTLPELEGCVTICLSSDGSSRSTSDLLEAITQNFALRGVSIHHSYWLYEALPRLHSWDPTLPIVDSLHIVEYLNGGFAGCAVQYDEFIDVHHAISPELTKWLTRTQGLDPSKVVLAPLASLTVTEHREYQAREASSVFTIAFIGRLSRQKRPDVFLKLVQQLCRLKLPIRAILHGDGELRQLVEELLDRYKLRSVVEVRLEDTPVNLTLRESNLLVITSVNEGLTLTTFEAIAVGVPVLSTDVGSQRTVIQDDLLLPRPANKLIRSATRVVQRFIESDDIRERSWQEQQDRVKAFAHLPSAQEWFAEMLLTWK